MNKKGFTLVELLAVIVLLGIVAVAAITSVSGMIESNKKKRFVAMYNELRNQVNQRIMAGTYVSSIDVTRMNNDEVVDEAEEVNQTSKSELGTDQAKDYGLNESDYSFFTFYNPENELHYLVLVGNGTYKDVKLQDESDKCGGLQSYCSKIAGTGSCIGNVILGTLEK